MTKRTDDYDEIVRVVQLYIDGFNDNDINKFKEAFHEDAWMLSWDRAADKSAGWIDFHNLLRINGVWKIMNKSATHSSR